MGFILLSFALLCWAIVIIFYRSNFVNFGGSDEKTVYRVGLVALQ